MRVGEELVDTDPAPLGKPACRQGVAWKDNLVSNSLFF